MVLNRLDFSCNEGATDDAREETLDQLLEASRSYLLLIANRKLTPDLRVKCAASDLVQETLMSAVATSSQFTGKTPQELLAWLRGILMNHLMAVHRRYRGTQKRQTNREVSRQGSLSSLLDLDDLASYPSPPDKELVAEESRNLLMQALHQLPKEHRQIIEMRHRDHLSIRQIAERLGKTPAAVRSRWSRAIRSLRKSIKSAELAL